jgi:peptidoglycan/LPS O-acetylase OafA/YrhL
MAFWRGAVLQSDSSTNPTTDRIYFPTLDDWRAVAVTLVVIAHGYPSIQRAASFIQINPGTMQKVGTLGVHVFFGISGFLITSRLIFEERLRSSVSLQSFYIRRFFRIVPAALGFLTAVGLLTWFGVLDVTPRRWVDSLLFYANYSNAQYSYSVGHIWSLAVEEHFYFIWPLIYVGLMTTGRRVTAAVILALIIAAWRAVDWKYQLTWVDPAKFFGRTDIHGDALLWGVAIALLASSHRASPVLKSIASNGYFWFLLLVAIPLLSLADVGWKAGFAFLTMIFVAIPIVIYGTTISPATGLFYNLLEDKRLRFVGRLS